MYILYIDDAGSVGNHSERHFVLAGVALYERHVYFLGNELDRIAEQTGLDQTTQLEFHGNQLLPGSKKWRQIRDRPKRRAILVEALRAAEKLHGRWALFGVVVNKAAISPRDPAEYAFEQLCSRFDKYLIRINRRRVDDKRPKHGGLIVMDKTRIEPRLQSLAKTFRTDGHSWGKTRNLVEVPLFVDSSATCAIQYADLVTYALWRRFEMNDPEFFDTIKHRFDSEGGVVHGLLHERYAESSCDCPYCHSRR